MLPGTFSTRNCVFFPTQVPTFKSSCPVKFFSKKNMHYFLREHIVLWHTFRRIFRQNLQTSDNGEKRRRQEKKLTPNRETRTRSNVFSRFSSFQGNGRGLQFFEVQFVQGTCTEPQWECALSRICSQSLQLWPHCSPH